MTSKRKEYDQYINSEKWRLKRSQFLAAEERNQRCAGCGYTGPGIEVHHRTYLHLGNEPLTDLVGVCYRCHMMIHQNMDTWNPKLSQHTDNVLAEIARKVSTGELKRTTVSEQRYTITAQHPTSTARDKPQAYVASVEVQNMRRLLTQIKGQYVQELRQQHLEQKATKSANNAAQRRRRRNKRMPVQQPHRTNPGTDNNHNIFERVRARQTGEGFSEADRRAVERRRNGL